MPYIKMEERGMIDQMKIGEALKLNGGAGWFAYAVYRLCLNYLGRPENRTFQQIALLIGVLEAIKMEFYQRVAVPYEDGKIKSNGDVS